MGETTRDLFLYGGLAVGAYFIVKSLTEPLTKPISALSDLTTKIVGFPEYIWDNGGVNQDNVNKTKKIFSDTASGLGTALNSLNPINLIGNRQTTYNWSNIPISSLGVRTTLSPQVQALASGTGSYALNGGIFVNPDEINPAIITQLKAGTFASTSSKSSIYKTSTIKNTSSANQSYTGARIGTIFKSGASVKSVGKNGLY